MLKSALALSLTSILLATTAQAADAQATAARLVATPGANTLQLVDVGTMPPKFEAGTLVILCDAQCQAALHLAGKPSGDNNQVAMGITINMDALSKVGKLLGRTVN